MPAMIRIDREHLAVLRAQEHDAARTRAQGERDDRRAALDGLREGEGPEVVGGSGPNSGQVPPEAPRSIA